MKYLKIISAILLAAFMTVCLCSCGKSGRMTFENAMSAINKADFTKLRTLITEKSAETIESAEKNYSKINDLSAEVYENLMSFVKYSYTEGDTVTGDRMTLHLSITHVDTTRLINDVAARISVSGASSWHEIDVMIANGTIENNYIITDKTDVILEDVGGRWLLAFDDDKNASFLSSIGIIGFLRWFAAQQK